MELDPASSFQNLLLPGEKILWSVQVQPRRPMVIFVCLYLAAFIVIFCCVAINEANQPHIQIQPDTASSNSSDGDNDHPRRPQSSEPSSIFALLLLSAFLSIFVVFAFFWVYMMSTILVQGRLAHLLGYKIAYALTNERLMTHISARRIYVRSLYLSQIREVWLLENKDGSGTIEIAPAEKVIPPFGPNSFFSNTQIKEIPLAREAYNRINEAVLKKATG